jgi:hypothetical protein
MEVNHPSPRMRRQAEHLRFILEAPKLQRSPDERVNIPILKDVERKCDLSCRTLFCCWVAQRVSLRDLSEPG